MQDGVKVNGKKCYRMKLAQSQRQRRERQCRSLKVYCSDCPCLQRLYNDDCTCLLKSVLLVLQEAPVPSPLVGDRIKLMPMQYLATLTCLSFLDADIPTPVLNRLLSRIYTLRSFMHIVTNIHRKQAAEQDIPAICNALLQYSSSSLQDLVFMMLDMSIDYRAECNMGLSFRGFRELKTVHLPREAILSVCKRDQLSFDEIFDVSVKLVTIETHGWQYTTEEYGCGDEKAFLARLRNFRGRYDAPQEFLWQKGVKGLRGWQEWKPSTRSNTTKVDSFVGTVKRDEVKKQKLRKITSNDKKDNGDFSAKSERNKKKRNKKKAIKRNRNKKKRRKTKEKKNGRY